MEPNQEMLTALLGLAVLIWGFMEGVGKPLLYELVKLISKRSSVEVTDDGTYWIFDPYLLVRIVAALIGIGAVWALGDLSFGEAWGLDLRSYEVIDIVTTGVIVSLGNKGIHWLVDLIRDNGDLIKTLLELKGKPNTPKLE